MYDIKHIIMLTCAVGAVLSIISITIMAIIDNKRNDCYQKLREEQRKNRDKL